MINCESIQESDTYVNVKVSNEETIVRKCFSCTSVLECMYRCTVSNKSENVVSVLAGSKQSHSFAFMNMDRQIGLQHDINVPLNPTHRFLKHTSFYLQGGVQFVHVL